MIPDPPALDAGAHSGTLGRALALVHTRQVDRRSGLTDSLGLSRTATGAVLRDLEELCLVRTLPGSRSESGGTGRPSPRIEIHPKAPMALAVQIQNETVVLADVSLGGTLERVVKKVLPRPADPEAVLGYVAAAISCRLDEAAERYLGVGLAVPSAVGADGTALAALNLGWPRAVPVRGMMRELLAERGRAASVHVGNDANLAALAEYRHGAGKASKDLLYVTTGQRGVGGGLVLSGRLHVGSAGYALEVGHIVVEPSGCPCHCGSTGCLDVVADPWALLAAADVEGSGSASSSRGIESASGVGETALAAARGVIAAAATDATAMEAVRLVTTRLATGLASLVNVLNPDRIVLGGMYRDLFAVAESELRAVLTHRSYLDDASRVEIRAGVLPRPTLAGAAEIAFQPLLDNPRYLRRSVR